MLVSASVKKLSVSGLINILSSHSHVNLATCESKMELQECLQCNLNDGLIDEIEVILELSGE